jgi:hypothetical protein
MCVLKLTLGKIIFLQIFPMFSASSVNRLDSMLSRRVSNKSRREPFDFFAIA